MGRNDKADACTFWVSTYPWRVPVFTFKPLVFTWREQFSHALTGFVSCVGLFLLATTLVVCKIIVIQTDPLLTSSMQQALFKSVSDRVMEEELQFPALFSAIWVGQNWQRNYEFKKPDKKGGTQMKKVVFLLIYPLRWNKRDSIEDSKQWICYYILYLLNNYLFASESPLLDERRKFLQWIQVCLATAVSPKTAIIISSSFVREQLRRFHSKKGIGFESCVICV